MCQMGGFGPMPDRCTTSSPWRARRIAVTAWALHGGNAPPVRRDRSPAGQSRILAGALSVADFAILGWAWRHERHKVALADFPHVGRWYDALMARPGVKARHGSKTGLRKSKARIPLFSFVERVDRRRRSRRRRRVRGAASRYVATSSSACWSRRSTLAKTRGRRREVSRPLRLQRHLDRQAGEHRAHQPALHQQPARPACRETP